MTWKGLPVAGRRRKRGPLLDEVLGNDPVPQRAECDERGPGMARIDMNEIEPGLFQGGVAGGLLEVPENIEAIVNLRRTYDLYMGPFHSRFVGVLWFPMEDGVWPGVPWLDMVVKAVMGLRASRYCTLIHCAAGVSRSATVTAAYLMASYGHDADTALRMVAEKRPIVEPAAAFRAGLHEYQLFLRGS